MAQSEIGHEALTVTSATALHTPGEVIEIVGSEGLKRYQYVQYDDGTANVTLAAGNPVGYKVTDHRVVYADLTDTAANLVAGVALGACTTAYYMWIQTWGYNSAVDMNTDDDAAVGQSVIWSDDQVCDTVAAGTASTYRPLGICEVAVVAASNTAGVYLTCL